MHRSRILTNNEWPNFSFTARVFSFKLINRKKKIMNHNYQFVHAYFLREKYKIWWGLFHWFYDKLFVIEADVPNLRPRKSRLWSQFIFFFVDVQSKSRYTKPQICFFLVLIMCVYLKLKKKNLWSHVLQWKTNKRWSSNTYTNWKIIHPVHV